MDIRDVFSVVAGILGIGLFIPYIVGIFKGDVRPMKATWFIWASLDAVTISGMYAENAVNGQIAGAFIGAWTVFFLSLKYGVPGITKLDVFCLVAVALSILLWQMFDSPLAGILISSFANCVGALPTIRSAWQDPSRENKLAWCLGTLASFCALASITEWTPAHYIQPMAFLLIQVPMLLLLFTRRVPDPNLLA